MEAYRQQIDELDQAMFELLLKRLQVVEEISQHKEANGLAIYDPEREKKKIKAIGGKQALEKQMLLCQTMAIGRFTQKKSRIERIFLQEKKIDADEERVIGFNKEPILGVVRDNYSFIPHENCVIFNKREELIAAIEAGKVEKGIFYEKYNGGFMGEKTKELILSSNIFLSSLQRKKNEEETIIEAGIPYYNFKMKYMLLYIEAETMEDYSLLLSTIKNKGLAEHHSLQIEANLTGQLFIKSDSMAQEISLWNKGLQLLAATVKDMRILFYGDL